MLISHAAGRRLIVGLTVLGVAAHGQPPPMIVAMSPRAGASTTTMDPIWAAVDKINKSGHDQHGKPCVWPHCLPKCHQCPGKKVGTCWLKMVGMDEHDCINQVANSSCILGRCICKSGFCANPDPENPDGYVCKPAVCENEGTSPRPPPFVPSWHIHYWLLFAPTDAFPPPEWMEANYKSYLKSIIALPAILFTIGVVIACMTGGILCCGCTGHHFVHGKKSSKGRSHLDSGDRPPKPGFHWHCCLCFLAVLIVSITTFATIRRYHDNQQLVDLIEHTMGDVEHHTQTVATQARQINTSVEGFMDSLDLFVHQCAEGNNSMVKPIASKFAGDIEGSLHNYRGMVRNYTETTQPIPGEVRSAKEWVLGHHDTLAFAPNIPLICLATVCLGILAEAAITMAIGSSSCGKCVDESLRFAAILFVFIILGVTVAITIGSVFGITFSHFCTDPDHNTMVYVDYYSNDSAVDNAASFYLSGQVINPLLTMAQLARKYVIVMGHTYGALAPAIQTIEGLCTSAHKINVTNLLSEADTVLSFAEDILKAKNIWPFYQNVVREGVCFDLVRSLGQMVGLQFLVGLIIFPITAILTHTFLAKWSDWEQWVEEEEDDEKVSLTEDYSDDYDDEPE